MAVDMFIKIGALEGESTDKTHGKEIDVLAWSWGMSNSGSAHHGGGQGAGKVNVQDLSFTKWIDKSSPDLMLACCNGKHFPEAKLVVRKADFKALLAQHVELYEALLRLNCRRLRLLFDTVEDLNTLPLAARLAKQILLLARSYGVQQGDEIRRWLSDPEESK